MKALIASHKQQAAYIDVLHEELRRLNVPSYRPAPANAAPVAMYTESVPVQTPAAAMQPPSMGMQQPMPMPGSGQPMMPMPGR